MGLEKAPKAYQRMLGSCPDTGFGRKKSLIKRFGTKPYIDDLLHGTPYRGNLERSEKLGCLCIEDHEHQLRELFEILAYYKLSLKPENSKMFVTRVKFCRHILTPGRRHRDLEKVAAIERWRWQDITDLTHLTKFLGFTHWYSVYIHDYARMAAPLETTLQVCASQRPKRRPKSTSGKLNCCRVLVPATGPILPE